MKLAPLHEKMPSWLLITAAVFVSIITIIVIVGVVFEETHRNTIMPGVVVGGISIGGKTPAEARVIVDGIIEKLEKGTIIRFENKELLVPTPLIALDPDIAVNPLIFDADETLRQAWSVGRSSSWLQNIINQARVLVGGKNISIVFTADEPALTELLKKEFDSFNHPARNAGIEFTDAGARITPEESGQQLQYKRALTILLKNMHQGLTDAINLESKKELPDITAAQAESLLPDVDSFLDIPETKLVYEKHTWKLTKEQARSWLGFAREKNKLGFVLDPEKIKTYVTKDIAPEIEQAPVEARLSMDGSRVSVWQAGKDGLTIDLNEIASRISAWPKDHPESIEVPMVVTASTATDANAEELGLKEIIGTGTSQFSGSPANRRHNIRTGANALHGLLIKPGEEFSLLKALGNIDGSNGYLQELVIKENKTIPEYGGGLCQIGTTMFRATFNSGLPVTQRRNHSYRVVYYEPAGTDATIYDPAPDYRFVNDTGHYILIQARMSGDSLAFDFWGTKDGRNIEVSKPVIYNIVKPAPTKIVETTDLPEGKKKCTESAHAGADAYFDYKVTYSGGEVKQQRFSSHYVPWQAVCLVGVKKSPDGSLPGASSTTITPAITPAVNPATN